MYMHKHVQAMSKYRDKKVIKAQSTDYAHQKKNFNSNSITIFSE